MFFLWMFFFFFRGKLFIFFAPWIIFSGWLSPSFTHLSLPQLSGCRPEGELSQLQLACLWKRGMYFSKLCCGSAICRRPCEGGCLAVRGGRHFNKKNQSSVTWSYYNQMIKWIVLLFPLWTHANCVFILVAPNYNQGEIIANGLFWVVVLAAIWTK